MEALPGIAMPEKVVPAPAALFLTEESNRNGLRRCVSHPTVGISESPSSLAVGESSENEEEEDNAVSSFSSSLEDSLPIKRGLSNHYKGKSKSFSNLLEASNYAKDLEKVESPLNKRRRLLIANKLIRRRRRSSSLSYFSIYSSKTKPKSMPLLALQESDEEEDHNKYNYDNVNDNYNDDSSDDETSKLKEKRIKMTNNNNNRDYMVQTQSCVCLTSFQDGHR